MSNPSTTALSTIRGTAYTFNTPDPIAGAVIKVVEFPEVSATTTTNGSYELQVPAGSKATPYIEAAGHSSIHLQTFTLDDAHEGSDIDGVNFQTPTHDIYDGLKVLVESFIGRDPFEGGGVIVSTVSDAKVVGMPFDQFIEFHSHGVPGAVAFITPALARPIYFNQDVIPDNTQSTTSIDGGVLWPNVPPGRYVLTAELEGKTFARVEVECEIGRVVNANPVWGLHEIPSAS